MLERASKRVSAIVESRVDFGESIRDGRKSGSAAEASIDFIFPVLHAGCVLADASMGYTGYTGKPVTSKRPFYLPNFTPEGIFEEKRVG